MRKLRQVWNTYKDTLHIVASDSLHQTRSNSLFWLLLGFLFWKHTSFTMVLKVYFRKHLQNFCYYKLNFVQKIMRKYKTGRIFAFSLKNWSKKVKLLIWVRPQGFNAIYEHSVKILKCLNCVLTHFKKWCCPFKCVSHVGGGGGNHIHLQKVSYVQ